MASTYRTSYGTDRAVNYANWSTHEGARFTFQFGAYGDTQVVVFGAPDHLEDALEEAASWLKDNAPGHLIEDWGSEHQALYDAVWDELFPGVEELTDEQREQVHEQATADLTYTESGYLASREWHVHEETDDRPDHHYTYGSGSPGCLYDYGPELAETVEQAIESFKQVFSGLRSRELTLMAHALRTEGIYYFRHPSEAGAQYCEVSKQHEPMPLDASDE